MTQPVPVPTPPPGDPAPATPPVPKPPADSPKPDDDSGDHRKGGDRAVLADLAKERDRRQKLEQQLTELAPLKQLAELIGGGQKPPDGKSEVDLLNEKFASYESDLKAEREARWRAEVAAEKGLTAQQAARLQGASREDLAADADALVALFPTAGPRTPVPDPSQGARLGATGVDIAAQVAEATKAGDWRKAAALEKTKLANLKR
jgi:hypothetical protein